jgi:hypothetical protein
MLLEYTSNANRLKAGSEATKCKLRTEPIWVAKYASFLRLFVMKNFSPHQMHGVDMLKRLYMSAARNGDQRGSRLHATGQLASPANAISVKQPPTLMTTQAAVITTMCAGSPSEKPPHENACANVRSIVCIAVVYIVACMLAASDHAS